MDVIVSRDEWYQADPQGARLDNFLAARSLARVPFYGGFKVFRIDREPSLHVEGFRHSWPFVDVFLYDHCTRRIKEDWKHGILVQGKPPWFAKEGYQTQWFYEYADVFPATMLKFGSIIARVPRNAWSVLCRDYGSQCLNECVAPRWNHKQECYTNYCQKPVQIETVVDLYEGYRWCPEFYWQTIQ